jgi:hypothetical protein
MQAIKSNYYYQRGNGFNFIKSSGNLERDRQIVNYRGLLSSIDAEIKEYEMCWSGNK